MQAMQEMQVIHEMQGTQEMQEFVSEMRGMQRMHHCFMSIDVFFLFI